MRAKRNGSTYVYTQPASGAFVREDTPAEVEAIPVTTPQDVIHNPLSAVIPERVCPHGGVYFHDMCVCGVCGGDDDNLFGLAVMHVARKTAYKVPVTSDVFTFDDVVMTCATALVANRKRILTAKNPTALAFTIAHRAALKLYRSRSVKTMAVGRMKFESGEETQHLETTTQRLEYLDALRQYSEEQEQWARQCYERARVFPGLNLMWTAENFDRLQEAIESGRRQLPLHPFDVWRVIDMRLGLSEGMEEHSWKDLASSVSRPWDHVTVTARQAKYAYDSGLKFLKVHLMRTLVPDTEKILSPTKSPG